jgi:hypothetical protein
MRILGEVDPRPVEIALQHDVEGKGHHFLPVQDLAVILIALAGRLI